MPRWSAWIARVLGAQPEREAALGEVVEVERGDGRLERRPGQRQGDARCRCAASRWTRPRRRPAPTGSSRAGWRTRPPARPPRRRSPPAPCVPPSATAAASPSTCARPSGPQSRGWSRPTAVSVDQVSSPCSASTIRSCSSPSASRTWSTSSASGWKPSPANRAMVASWVAIASTTTLARPAVERGGQRRLGQRVADALAPARRIDHEAQLADVARPADAGDHRGVADDVVTVDAPASAMLPVGQPALHRGRAGDRLLEERAVALGHPVEEGDARGRRRPRRAARRSRAPPASLVALGSSSQAAIAGIDSRLRRLADDQPDVAGLEADLLDVRQQLDDRRRRRRGGTMWSASPTTLSTGQSIERRSIVRPPSSISPRTRRSSCMNQSHGLAEARAGERDVVLRPADQRLVGGDVLAVVEPVAAGWRSRRGRR